MILTKIEKDNLNLLDHAYKKDLNLIKFHASNTEYHELAKAKICYWLIKNNKNFVTEARLRVPGRPDVFNITDGVVYEVLHTEFQKNVDVKRNRHGLYIVSVDALELLGQEFEDLNKYLG